MPEANPYAPPGTELSPGQAPPGRRIGWKLYLWLLVALTFLIYLGFGVSWMQAADLLDLAVACVALLGLFGHAHRRALGTRGFWSLWLLFQIVWDLAINFALEPAGLAYQFSEAESSTPIEAAIGFLFVLPLYAALFLYAHRSPELWSGR